MRSHNASAGTGGDADAAGGFSSEFEYAESWLQHPQRFALDPLSMPLRRGRFVARNLEPPMVFNGAFGNTDDHLKNFWMVHDTRGFRLSPAFDLVPDVGEKREHTLAFEYERGAPARGELLVLAKRWGVARAEGIIDEVLASMARFADAARERGVPAANIAEIGSDISRRVARLR